VWERTKSEFFKKKNFQIFIKLTNSNNIKRQRRLYLFALLNVLVALLSVDAMLLLRVQAIALVEARHFGLERQRARRVAAERAVPASRRSGAASRA
jgi:hypothetical protein